MCCGYKQWVSSPNECFLAPNSSVVESLEPYVEGEDIYMFRTTTLTPECANTDTYLDFDGDTCSSFYEHDNTACGKHDTILFQAY
jgi:hypothetical protein